jgi:hypothetical protein
MAIGVQMDFSGGSLAQYDEVIKKMGFHPGGPGAPGGLFHWVTTTDDGLRVTDVWDTREHFEKFSSEKVQPLTAEVGFAAPPKVTFFKVHNYLTQG